MAVALVIGLFVIALRMPLMDLPLERDEGGYAFVAWRMLHGEMPYTDFFTQKPPGIFIAYHAALRLGGDSVVSFRAAAAVFAALSSVALFFLVRALLGFGAAVVSAVLLGFLSADPIIQGSIANTEVFMLPGLIAATAVFLKVVAASRAPAGASLAVGVLLGVAAAFKQVAAVNAVFFALVLLFAAGSSAGGRARRLVCFLGWATLGGLLVWGPIVLWLLWEGALAEAVDGILLHNLEYAQALPWSVQLEAISHYTRPLFPSQGPAWLLAAGGLAALAARKDRFPALFLGGWAVANAVGVSASGRYFPHYFQQLLPVVAAAVSGLLLLPWPRAAVPRRLRDAIVCALAVGPLAAVAASFWGLSPADAVERIYPANPFEAMPAIAGEVAALTRPDDRVFVFGADPEILYYAKRRSATRYAHLFALFGSFSDVDERQRGVAAEIERAQPAAIVYVPSRMTSGGGRPHFLTEWVTALLERSYRLHAVVLWGHQDRGKLVRVGGGARARSRGQGWASIYVRRNREIP